MTLTVPQDELVELVEIAHLLGYSPKQAKKRAPSQQLPIPVFRLGGQRSPWLVKRSDLDAYAAGCYDSAKKSHKAISNARRRA